MESFICIRVWLWREGGWLIHLLVNLTSSYINTPDSNMATEIIPYPISMYECMYECLCVSVSMQIWKHWGHIQEQVKNHVLCHKCEGQREEKSVVHTRRPVLLYRLQRILSPHSNCVCYKISQNTTAFHFSINQESTMKCLSLMGESVWRKKHQQQSMESVPWPVFLWKHLLDFPRMGGNCQRQQGPPCWWLKN